MLSQNEKHRIYVINLKKRKDRRDLMIYKLNKIGITNYTFFEAVDGTNHVYDTLYKMIGSKNSFTSRGSLGIILTYIQLLQDAYIHGYDKILILEDDVNFHKEFDQLTDDFADIMQYGLYDLIWIGANQTRYSQTQLHCIEKNKPYLPEPLNGYPTFGAYSIMLNRRAIYKLMKIINYHNLTNLKPIDHILNNVIATKSLTGIVCYPFLVLPDVTDSNNMGPRNQSRFCRSRNYDINDYDYIPVSDIMMYIKSNPDEDSDNKK